MSNSTQADSCLANYPDGLPVVTPATACKIGLAAVLAFLLAIIHMQGCFNPRTSKTTRFGIGLGRVLGPVMIFLLLLLLTNPALSIVYAFIGQYDPLVEGNASNTFLEMSCLIQYEATVVPIFMLLPIIFISLAFVFNGVRVWTRWNFGAVLQKELSQGTFAAKILHSADSPSRDDDSDSATRPIRVVILTVFRGAFLAPAVTALRNIATNGRNVEVHALDCWGTAIEPESDAWARRNAELEGIADCITFTHWDFVSPLPFDTSSVDVVLVPIARSTPFSIDKKMSEHKKAELTAALLHECTRVMRPGAAFACMTTKWFETPSWIKKLSEAPLVKSEPATNSNRNGAKSGALSPTAAAKRAAASSVPAALAFADVHSRPENIWLSFVPFQVVVGYRRDAPIPSPPATAVAVADGSSARHSVASLKLSMPPPLLPPVPWFPTGDNGIWRLRDVFVLLILVFYGLLLLVVTHNWSSVAHFPSAATWGTSIGSLLISCITTVTAQAYAIATTLNETCKEIRDEGLMKQWEQLRDWAAIKTTSTMPAAQQHHSRQGSSSAVVISSSSSVASATAPFAASSSSTTDNSSAKAPLLASEETSAASKGAIARLSLAREASVRLSLKADSSTLLPSAVPPRVRVTWAYLISLRNVLLALTIYQIISWLPGFLGTVLLVAKFGMERETANRIVTIATVFLLVIIPWIGKRIYARYQARKEAKRAAEEAAEEEAQALLEAAQQKKDDEEEPASSSGSKNNNAGDSGVAVVPNALVAATTASDDASSDAREIRT
jgi:hypothetical protein